MGTVADAWRAPAVTGPVGSDAPVPATAETAPATPAPAPSVPVTGMPSPAPSSPVVRDPDAAAKAAAAALLATRPDVLAARAAVRASRLDMEEELERLEAAARAAVDVKAKVKRNPARSAGAAAGIGFLAGRRATQGRSAAPAPRCSASPIRCPSRCCPRRSRRPSRRWAPTGRRSAARSSATSPTTSRRPRSATRLDAVDRAVPPAADRPDPDPRGSASSSSRRSCPRGAASRSSWPGSARARRRQGRAAAGPLAPPRGRRSPARPEPAGRCATLADGRVAEWQTRRP